MPFLILMTIASLSVRATEVAPESAAPASPEASSDNTDAPPIVALPWLQPSGTGVGFAFDNGSWGGAWMQGVRVRIPFSNYFGANVRGIMLMDFPSGSPLRINAGGRVELFGQTPVFLNILRLYGGGGIQMFTPVSGSGPLDQKIQLGGGGYFGFEFFMRPQVSWILEVGGDGGSSSFGSGATISAGIQFYPFSSNRGAHATR